MTAPARLAYRPDIDGIRAIAVLLVVVFHFRLMPGIHSGFVGVDVFFVISGFLITTIVQRQLDAQTFRLGTFWMNRIRRLAPALVATTVLTLLAGWVWLLPADFVKLANQTIAAQLYYANIFFWRNVNYFGLQAHDVYLLHTWSLAVEEQFYIVFPLVLLAVAKWARRANGGRAIAPIAVVVIAALASFALNMAFVAHKPEATFYLMPTRAWELLAGAILALYVSKPRIAKPAAAEFLGVSGFACVLVSIIAYRDGFAFPGLFALWPAAAGVLLILSGSTGASISSRILSVRPLAYFGRISYPLYLVHWPVNVFATDQWGRGYAWGWRLFMLAVSVALAALIYHAVEGPVRRWLEKAPAKVTVRLYLAAVAFAVGFAALVIKTEGVPSRFPEPVARLAAFARDSPPQPIQQCEYSVKVALTAESLCRLGAKDVAAQWFIYGDSHAWAASGALDQWLKQTGQAASFVFVHGCPPVRGVYVLQQGSACFSFNSAALTYLKAQPSLTRVLLISTWRQAKEGALSPAAGLKLSPDESIQLFDRQFAATIGELKEMGKRIYVWEPVPGAKSSVPNAMARSALDATPLDIDFTRAEYLADSSYFFDALRKQQSAIDGTFSSAAELCGSGRCMTAFEGKPLYFDTAHLTYSFSPFWAAALGRQLPGRDEGSK